MAGTHTQREDFPWIIAVVDHPERSDSPAYVHSRALMRRLVATTPDWALAGEAYQDHHGGSVWVKDDVGWLCLQLPLGIEWSAQFCADPGKIDRLRQYAARVVAAFPATLPGYEAFGYRAATDLLATPIADAAGVAAWTDSIFNASLPLPARAHTGVLPKGAGYHHYPKPIVDIDHFRYDDFTLFVTDAAGHPAVVVPVAPRGSGDGRVRLLGVHPDSPYVAQLGRPSRRPATLGVGAGAPVAERRRVPRPASRDRMVHSDDGVHLATEAQGADVLAADDPLAREAFARQG